jgi:hypothetical protein
MGLNSNMRFFSDEIESKMDRAHQQLGGGKKHDRII